MSIIHKPEEEIELYKKNLDTAIWKEEMRSWVDPEDPEVENGDATVSDTPICDSVWGDQRRLKRDLVDNSYVPSGYPGYGGKCPSCGYCPICGRGQPRPWYPYAQPYAGPSWGINTSPGYATNLQSLDNGVAVEC